MDSQEASALLKEKDALSQLKQFVAIYFSKYGYTLKEQVRKSFFEAILEAKEVADIPSSIREAIEGTSKYIPIFSRRDDGVVAGKVEQVRMRLLHATKEKRMGSAQLEREHDRISSELLVTEAILDSLRQAAELTLEDVRGLSFDRLREVLVGTEEEHAEDRQMAQFIPSGPLTEALLEMVDQGVYDANSAQTRVDLKRAQKLILRIHQANTPDNLSRKENEMLEKIEKLKKSHQRIAQERENLKKEPLERFDAWLKQLSGSILENLGKTRRG